MGGNNLHVSTQHNSREKAAKHPPKSKKEERLGQQANGRAGGVCDPRVYCQTVPESLPAAGRAQMSPHSRE